MIVLEVYAENAMKVWKVAQAHLSQIVVKINHNNSKIKNRKI
jgi:hypothetical protein